MRQLARKRYRERHREKLARKQRLWYEKNRERVLAKGRTPEARAATNLRKRKARAADPAKAREKQSGYFKKYYQKNKEKVKARIYSFRKLNPEKIRLQRERDKCRASQRKAELQLTLLALTLSSKLKEIMPEGQ